MVLPAAIIIVGMSVIGLILVTKPEPAADQNLLAEAPRPKVLVRPAHREVVTLSAFSQGSVTPKREIELVAQVAGKIIAVEPQFEEGAFFDNGSLLIEIDDRDYLPSKVNNTSYVTWRLRHGRNIHESHDFPDFQYLKAILLFLE